MDWQSWFIVIGLIVVSSTLSAFYFEFPVSSLLSFGFAAVIVCGAYKIEKYLQLNNGSRTE